MSYTKAVDISQWQSSDDYAEPIVVIKVSGGDAGLYYDSKATQHYNAATSAGKSVGMYHFAGAGDPIAEADHFIRACSPLAENDVLILDWEVHHANPPEWCRAFIQHVKDVTGVTCIIYMNTSTENSFDWSPVINLNVGLWVADYRFSPEENVPIQHWPTYVMHQFTSTPIDQDAFFGSVDQFRAYGFHADQPAPVAAPAPEPTPVPVAVPVEPTPVPPVVSTIPTPVPTSITPHDVEQDQQISYLSTVVAQILAYLKRFKLFQRFLNKK